MTAFMLRPKRQSFYLPFFLVLFLLSTVAKAQLWQGSFPVEGSADVLELTQHDQQSWQAHGRSIPLRVLSEMMPAMLDDIEQRTPSLNLSLNEAQVQGRDQLMDQLAQIYGQVPLQRISYWFERYRQERPSAIQSNPPQGLLKASRAMFITHASAVFDQQGVVKSKIDQLIEVFQADQAPVIFVLNRDQLDDITWLTQVRRPDYVIESGNGHFQADLDIQDVTLTGGYLSLCFHRTLGVVLDRNRAPKSIIRIPLAGVYEDKYYFVPEVPTAAYWQWRESVKAPINLRQILDAVGESTFKKSVTALFERRESQHLTVKLGQSVIKRYPAKKSRRANSPKVRSVEIIFE